LALSAVVLTPTDRIAVFVPQRGSDEHMWSLTKREGDQVKGFTVVAIDKEAVTIASEGETHRLRIGDGVPVIDAAAADGQSDVEIDSPGQPAIFSPNGEVQAIELDPDTIHSGMLVPGRVEPEHRYSAKRDGPAEVLAEPANIDDLRFQASEFFQQLHGLPEFRDSVERARRHVRSLPTLGDMAGEQE
jgi:hypothetical protein